MRYVCAYVRQRAVLYKLHSADDRENTIWTARCCPQIVHLAERRRSRHGCHRKSMRASVYSTTTDRTEQWVNICPCSQSTASVAVDPHRRNVCPITRKFAGHFCQRHLISSITHSSVGHFPLDIPLAHISRPFTRPDNFAFNLRYFPAPARATTT